MANISKITTTDGTTYDLKDTIARSTIPFGVTDSTSTNIAFTATVPNVTELHSGTTIILMNNKVTSTTNCTLNINGLGAKPIYTVTAATVRVTNQFAVNNTWMFIYNEERVANGCWDLVYLFNTDTHRSIQVNGTQILGNNTTALNLKAGSNVTLSNSGGTVTINASGGGSGGGTITGITMNGTSMGTSGVVDLGTVITEHQDISGKADKSATVSNVAYDSTNKKITKTINGSTTDVVTAATLKTAMELNNVDNTADANKNVLSSTKLTNARYIDGVSFDGSTDIVHYGVCETAAGTAAKTVTITGFDLKVGAIIYVKFTNNNTAISPTLNVNGTGAKPIYTYGASLIWTDDYTYGWFANDVLPLIYDGTSWIRPHAYNSHRKINVNDSEVLGNGSTPLNIKAGTNMNVSYDDGTVTFNSTDTNTHRPIEVNGSEVLGNTTTPLNLKAGSHVSISNNAGNVTIGLESDYITTQSFTASSALTVNGNSNANATITITKSGYTPLGIISISKTGTQNTTSVPIAWYLGGTTSTPTATVTWRNLANSTASLTTTVVILYRKN